MGRPPKIKSPNEMQSKIDKYFRDCDKKREPYTITGLAIALGFASRQSFLDYCERKDDKDLYADIVKKGKFMVENAYEKRLNEPYPTGAIFVLKNFGWRDQIDVEHGMRDGDPAVLTDLQLAARLAYLIELASRRRREQELLPEKIEGKKDEEK